MPNDVSAGLHTVDSETGTDDSVAKAVLTAFARAGAVHNGHFEIASRHHTEEYWEKSLLLRRTDLTAQISALLAKFVSKGAPTIVLGPAVGGAILAHLVAARLGCAAGFFDKDKVGELRLRRGYRFAPEERVALVDDIASTGHSIAMMYERVSALGLQVVSACVVVDRTSGTPEGQRDTRVPFKSLLCKPLPVNYEPLSCPLCASGIPLTRSAMIAAVIESRHTDGRD